MSNSKIKQALALYEEVYQLELAIFQVPVDLKTLFPQYPMILHLIRKII